MYTKGRTFLFFCCGLLGLIACGNSGLTPRLTTDAGPRDDGFIPVDLGEPDQGAALPAAFAWTGVNSSMQLIRELVDPASCASGWTALWDQRRENDPGAEQLLPLQPKYVVAFATVEEFAEALAPTAPLLNANLPTTRFSLAWPCFAASTAIREGFIAAIRRAQEAGYAIELTLLHHDAYPAELHEPIDQVGTLGGWAHPNAPEAFLAYVDLVLGTLGQLLPLGTVIYLANEPTPQLLDGYIGEGKYPPGGRTAGRSLATALINQRDALQQAGQRIREAGFVPAIAPNLRPLTGNTKAPGATLLEYLHNWWLADALINGCIDDDFNGECERYDLPGVDRLGLTFYGTMSAADEVVDFGLPGTTAQPLARRSFDFQPNAPQFEETLATVRARYANRLQEKANLEWGVAEIGFSHGNPTIQQGWLTDYLAAAKRQEVKFLGYHAIFSHAEFDQGKWYFHLVARCGPCELTEWGRGFLETVAAFDCAVANQP